MEEKPRGETKVWGQYGRQAPLSMSKTDLAFPISKAEINFFDERKTGVD
uniref:Uncharacterized protein n=1 Tax=Arundo donax TaxID=35708 RepID=A0A0A9BEN2_ARUDO